MNTYLYIDPNGTAVLVNQEDDQTSLACLQELVGGLIENVAPNALGCDAWVNEEGLVYGLEINLVGSFVLGRQIVGPVVLADYDREDGETLSVPALIVNTLERDGLLIEEEPMTSAQVAAARAASLA